MTGGHDDRRRATIHLLQAQAIGSVLDLSVLEQGDSSDRGSERMRADLYASLLAEGQAVQAEVAVLLAPHRAGLQVVAAAQTAWWLHPSRNRWLLRKVAPIAILLGVLMIAAAAVATVVDDDWARWYGGRSYLIGNERFVVVIRAFAAFGIGLALGALLGRTLPAFIFGLALSVAILFALGQAQQAWLAALPPHVLGQPDPVTGEQIGLEGSVTTAWGWIAPDGTLLSMAEARVIATNAGVPPPAPNDVQDGAAAEWLERHGYQGVQMGVTDADALGWSAFDSATFGLVGLVAVGGAFVLVNRRRPT